jgi:hypothetical protein
MRRLQLIVALAAIVVAAPALASDETAGRDHPLVKIVKAYRAAKKSENPDSASVYLSEDSRIWFGKKEGPGKKRKLGHGPWHEWDRFFNAKGKPVGSYEVNGREVSVVMEETNDYFRLLDRSGGRYRATYYFDEDDKIAGVLIAGTGEERDMGRYDEFVAWATENRPGLLEQLMPDGELDPALEKAKLWKQVLTEWRSEAGLPPID